MSRCRETLPPCRRPNRMLAKRFLRSFRPRTPRRKKRSQGLSTRKPQGNQLQHPSRRRLRLPERHRQPSSRLVHLCQFQPLLKHRRPSIDLCRHWPFTIFRTGKEMKTRLNGTPMSQALAARGAVASIRAARFLNATNYSPLNLEVLYLAFRHKLARLSFPHRSRLVSYNPLLWR